MVRVNTHICCAFVQIFLISERNIGAIDVQNLQNIIEDNWLPCVVGLVALTCGVYPIFICILSSSSSIFINIAPLEITLLPHDCLIASLPVK